MGEAARPPAPGQRKPEKPNPAPAKANKSEGKADKSEDETGQAARKGPAKAKTKEAITDAKLEGSENVS